MNKMVQIILVVTALVVLCGYIVATYPRHEHRVSDAEIVYQQQARVWNKHAVDTAISLLRSGYVVLRLGEGAESYLLAQINRKDKSWSHCGIVMMEHGYPFVYHSIGGEDNPDQRLRRDSAGIFFSPQHNMGMALVHYNFNDTVVNELRDVVGRYYRQRPKFDMQFDLRTDDKIYCAEFVYKALNQATHDSAYIKTTKILGYTIVGTDDLFMNPHADIIWQTKFK